VEALVTHSMAVGQSKVFFILFFEKKGVHFNKKKMSEIKNG